MNITTGVFAFYSLVAVVGLSACGEPAKGLTLTRVSLGGEHAEVLRTLSGESYAYDLRYAGDAAAYRVELEVFEKGKSVDKRQLLAGALQEEGGTVEGVLALMVTEPRREGDATEISGVWYKDGFSQSRHEQLESWDALASAGGGGTNTSWLPSAHFASPREPIVLWRSLRGSGSGLPSPVPEGAESVVQLTLRVDS